MVKAAIGKNLQEVGNGIFWNCMALETITVSEENPYLEAVENVLYDKEHTIMYAYAHNKPETEYHVLEGVKSLTECCILGNALKRLYMPKSLESLSYWSVACQPGLESIYFAGNAPSTAAHAIAFPSSSMLIYRIPDTTGWDGDQWKTFQFADWRPEGSISQEGTFDGISWTYDGSDGRLTFTGSGAIPDFTAEEAPPWGNYMSWIQTIHTNGVSRIGNYAFSDAENLIRVAADDALSEIGSYAFAGCTRLALPGIDMADRIEAYAF